MTRVSVEHQPEDRRLAMMRQLESLADAVRAPGPLDRVTDLVISQISDVVPNTGLAIWLFDTEKKVWYIGGARGLTRRASQVSFKSGQTLHDRVGEQGEILEDLNTAGFQRLYPEHDLVRSALYAPMTIGGHRVGLIALYRNDGGFGDDDLAFVRAVGEQVGMAISFAMFEAKSERAAVLEARNRLGADLHDGILQILSSLRMYTRDLRETMDSLRDGLDQEPRMKFAQALDQLDRCLDDSSKEMISTIGFLREPDTARDVRRMLELTRDRLTDNGIPADLVFQAEEIPPGAADALVWIAREAASNVIHHSGARHAEIVLREVGDRIELTIADDGSGFGSAETTHRSTHFGHVIMRERVGQLGGDLRLVTDSTGTTVRALIPVLPSRAPSHP